MSVELISVLIAVLAIGATLGGLILTSNRGLRQDMARLESRLDGRIGGLESRLREDTGKMESRLREDTSQLRDDIKQLGERVARMEHGQAKLEGLLEGLREAITGVGGRLGFVLSCLGKPHINKETYVFCSNSVGPIFFDGWPNGTGVGSTQVHFPAVRVWRGLGIDPDGAGVG